MKLTLELTPSEAAALATFLKRCNYDHFLSCTDGAALEEMRIRGGDSEQAYEMQSAASQIQTALADAGHSPR